MKGCEAMIPIWVVILLVSALIISITANRNNPKTKDSKAGIISLNIDSFFIGFAVLASWGEMNNALNTEPAWKALVYYSVVVFLIFSFIKIRIKVVNLGVLQEEADSEKDNPE